MKHNTIAVMGYPPKPNKYRLNSNRKMSTVFNSNGNKEKRRE